jgi:Family of unknown function (DUF6289)
MTKKMKLVIVALGLGIAGAAIARPAYGYEITYYDAQGGVVGGKELFCNGRHLQWGQTTPISDIVEYPCN